MPPFQFDNYPEFTLKACVILKYKEVEAIQVVLKYEVQPSMTKLLIYTTAPILT